MGIGNPVHLIFLGAIALVVLGPKRLPELARSLGNGIREFRESLDAAASGDQHAGPVSTPEQVVQGQPIHAEPVQPQQAQIAATTQPAAPAPIDPAEPILSGDAPDSRPL
jgi:TatA/E family protein of Tat protein translocase